MGPPRLHLGGRGQVAHLYDCRQATAPRVDVVRRCVDEGSVRNGDHVRQMKPNDSIFCCTTTSSVTASAIF